jgi:hypothetical protein
MYVTIEPIMFYTNVDIFREKGAKRFSKKCCKPLNFIKHEIIDVRNLFAGIVHKGTIFLIHRLDSRKVYQKEKKKVGVVV